MANQVYTVFSGDLTDTTGNVVKVQVVKIGDRSYIVIDDLHMGLQSVSGNLTTAAAGVTGAGRQIIKLTSIDGNDYELDVTNLGVPEIKPK